ncbi:MAG: VWA domain-containing protein [Acidobacteria bacterium]|nr:VWA domain-containing protein [Acidobacteriota bacterium]
MPRKVFRLLLLAIVSGAWVSAQEPIYTVKVDVPLVSIDVSVTDASGNPVSDLSQSDFVVLEDGVPQPIRHFSPVSAPYNILLLFDQSGSTQHKWLFMQKAVAGFLSNLKPQDRVAIAIFAEELEVLAKWTDSRTKALYALSELIRPRELGRTDFYRSLERVLKREFRSIPGRRATVVLTDGRDTSLYRQLVMTNRLLEPPNDREFQRILKTSREQRIPSYFIAVNTDLNFEPNVQGGDEYRNLQILFPQTDMPRRYLKEVRTRMEMISEVTGGRTLYPRTFEEVVPLYEQMARELGTAYSLGYFSPDPASGSAYRRIEVRLKNSDLRSVQSRAGYYAR